MLTSGEGRTALIAIAQNAAGQVFDQPGVRRMAQAAVPGDGAAVGLVTLSDQSPILDVECRTYGEYAGDMTLAIDPPASGGSRARRRLHRFHRNQDHQSAGPRQPPGS
ncbi:putative 3-oxoacyl-[acyl-carrier-protein] synthase [Mycobacterium xenopi 3993]|nr:putative 3-oxoacyl-[acyl-carrier-protein] synthase [Mycobacterium xenopi 3993]